MPVNDYTRTSFLYAFEAGSSLYALNDTVAPITVGDVLYDAVEVQHTAPTFGARKEDAEIEVTIKDLYALGDLFINGPAAYPIKLTIYEYDQDTQVATPYYRGWVVRVPFRLTDSLMQLRCKSVWHYFEREAMTDSLSALSRYSVYDPRAGVDMESLRLSVTVTALNETRDVLTVTGITEIDGWYSAGIIVTPDRDKRTILKHITEGPDKKLYLNGGFPEFSLGVGFNADIYPGDDLTYDTWANKFGSQTDHGEAWGGWQFMPNVDPAIRGVT